MKALEISGISFSYDLPPEKTISGESAYALHDFSLSVDIGQMHALLGPNGAGKTTLMRIITGQLRVKSGQITIYGSQMPNQDALRSIGYAPQPISLYTTLTAIENLRFFGTMAGLPASVINDRAEIVLEETGLSSYALKYVNTYSGGMLRRLNLAVALLHSPKLLLLDEPTVGVDPQSRHHIYETLSNLNVQGMTILLCTHIMDEAQRLCSKVTLLDKGSAIFNGNMNEINDLEKFFLEKTGRGLRDECA
jgi:ABC-2 type transport system ATP-binding protein